MSLFEPTPVLPAIDPLDLPGEEHYRVRRSGVPSLRTSLLWAAFLGVLAVALDLVRSGGRP